MDQEYDCINPGTLAGLTCEVEKPGIDFSIQVIMEAKHRACVSTIDILHHFSSNLNEVPELATHCKHLDFLLIKS